MTSTDHALGVAEDVPRTAEFGRVLRSVRHRLAWLGGLAHLVGGALDGLALGLVVAFLVATAISTPARNLGLNLAPALAFGLLATALALTVGATILAGLQLIVVRVGRLVGGALAGHGRLQHVVGWPFRVIAGLPAALLGALAVAVLLGTFGSSVGPFGLFLPGPGLTPLIYAAGLTGLLLGLARAAIGPAQATGQHPIRRGLAAATVAMAVIVAASAAIFAAAPGPVAGMVAADPVLDGAVRPTSLADPGAPGAFAVESLSYGSGTDLRRPAYGAEADIITTSVDATAALPRLGSGADEARAWFWGFGPDALPRNGLVWAPRGEGPFPLVLIVHGNHEMSDFSEPGYAYLASHLASRGFISASIDENFLNGGWADDWGGTEQRVRAWLLLRHLDLWKAWNADPASPFHGRVEMDRVALIGHSRGGEAAAVAASLAPQTYPMQLGLERWSGGLRVQAVVAIAPSERQYSHSGVTLRDTDYLTLIGGHDSDERAWSGIRQYARTLVDGDAIKAGLWTYRSNHGQFNTVWGNDDHGPFGGTVLNLAPLLTASEQQDVAKTAIAAFLEASLHGADGYRGFFRRPMVGREWLPEDIYLVRSLDGGFVPLTHADPMSPIEGLDVASSGFEIERTARLPLRALEGDQDMSGLLVRWSQGGTPAAWGLDGLADAGVLVDDEERPLRPDASTEIRFALANGADPTVTAPLNPMVEVTDTNGVTVALPLSTWGALPPALPVRLAKDDGIAALAGFDLSLASPVERVLQSYAIPLGDFAAVNPGLDPGQLAAFRLRFDRGVPGAAWIAEVGLGP